MRLDFSSAGRRGEKFTNGIEIEELGNVFVRDDTMFRSSGMDVVNGLAFRLLMPTLTIIVFGDLDGVLVLFSMVLNDLKLPPG